MNLKHISLVTTVLLASSTAAFAQAVQPNFYECSSFTTKVTLLIGNASEGEVGIYPPTSHMDISTQNKDFSFSEDQIVRESTLIGDLWEVQLSQEPDGHAEYATLVIPPLMSNDEPVHFKTKLILTRLYQQGLMDQSNEPQLFIPNLTSMGSDSENPSKYMTVYCTGSTLFF